MILVGTLAAMALVVAGCEDNSDTPTGGVLTIDPTSAQVSTNLPSVAFSASGGTGVYTWSVVEPSIGTVTSSGASAVYNARRVTLPVTTNSVPVNNPLVKGENVVVVTDDGGNTASARITQ